MSQGTNAVMRHRWGRGLVAAALVGMLSLVPEALAGGPSHPLDPLTGEEIVEAVGILRSAGKVSETTRFPIIRLEEPSKSEVKRWGTGERRLARQAFVTIFENTRTYEAIVDLARDKVRSFKEIKGVQAPILAEEYYLAHSVAVSDPAFQAALARRGITNLEALICLPLSAGYDAEPSEEGRRLLRVTCLSAADTSNAWSRPIENLTAVVDLNDKVVLRVVDAGVTPMATARSEFPPAPRPPNKPLHVVQPEGSDVRIEGNTIQWDRWLLHARVEPREGLIISDVAYRDNGRTRPILHRGALGEIFVPYADATPNWYFRTYMDEGEYGFGKATQPLVPGVDCPTNAHYLDVVLADDFGNPYQVPNGICVFERVDHMAVRHFDVFTLETMTRSGRELVVRSTTVVGNYDYMLEWIFKQDASMQVRAGAGGIMAVKGVHADTRQQDQRNETIYGPLVDHKLMGVMHQHFFNFRLDMDVDGAHNSLLMMDRKRVPAHIGGRRSAWVYVERLMEREQDATRHAGHHHSHAEWVVINPHEKNKLGYPTGYTVETHDYEEPLFTPEDTALQRAAFTASPLWATPYRPDELYSAGDYPNQSKGGEGLPAWTARNRNIKNKDLVLWVNVALGHVPRAEDWPVMPTEWFGSITFKPFMFFDRNPALDLHPSP